MLQSLTSHHAGYVALLYHALKGMGCCCIGLMCFYVCCCTLQSRYGAWECLQVAVRCGKVCVSSCVAVSVGQGWAAHSCARVCVSLLGRARAVLWPWSLHHGADYCVLLLSSCILCDKGPALCVRALCYARRLCSEGCAVPTVVQTSAVQEHRCAGREGC